MATDWLITGAGGQLGSVLLRLLTRRGAAVVGTVSERGPKPDVGEVLPIDLARSDDVSALLRRLRPRYIVHAAAVTNMVDAYRNPDLARQINFEMTRDLNSMAKDVGARVVFTSTDLVFDGEEPPYREDDVAKPRSVYGKTKVEAENALADSPNAITLRLSLMYGVPAVTRPTTFMHQLKAMLDRRELTLFNDEFRTPIWLEDAARACVDVARSDQTGILHIGGPERLSRLQMGELTAKALGIGDARIRAVSQCENNAPETRPADVSLDSSRFQQLYRRPAGLRMSEALQDIAQELSPPK